MEVRPYNYFRWYWYFWGPWVSFVTTGEFSVRFTKITRRIGVSWTRNLPFLIYFNSWILTILSKGCKPDYFEPHNSLKLSFTNIRGLCSNFVDCESILESNSPDILALILAQFFCEGLSSFNPKGFYYSYAWSCSLCEGRTSFCTGRIFRKLCRFLLTFSTGFTSLSVLLLFPLWIIFFVFIYGFSFYFI